MSAATVRIIRRMAAVDESSLELIVLESIKAATENSQAVFSRKEAERYKMVSQGPASLLLGERIGIFVTCLRTELIRRESRLTPNLKSQYETAKFDLCRTENWKDVGVFKIDDGGIRQTKRRRVFKRIGFPDINDFGSPVNAWDASEVAERKEKPDMDKTRIGAIASQVKQENTGFDFGASFQAMEGLIRDMNLMAKRHEHLSGQAVQVTEGLCAVAESLEFRGGESEDSTL